MNKIIFLFFILSLVSPMDISQTNYSCDDTRPSNQEIKIRKKGPVTRSIILESVYASYCSTTVFVSISGYSGIVSYEITDTDGYVSLSGSSIIEDGGSFQIPISSLDSGEYELSLCTLYEYTGTFDK